MTVQGLDGNEVDSGDGGARVKVGSAPPTPASLGPHHFGLPRRRAARGGAPQAYRAKQGEERGAERPEMRRNPPPQGPGHSLPGPQAAATPRSRPSVSLRKIILPVEHGSWGFLIEPILLGLLVAPSVAGAWLALAALAGFLVRHPLMLAIGDVRRGQRYPRTTAALQVAAGYGAAALGCLDRFALRAPTAAWIPLALAMVPAGIFLYHAAHRHVRTMAGELGGAVAMGSVATAIAVCGGWTAAAAFILWALLTARSVPTILYVRMQVRRLHGKDASATSERLAHLLAMAVVLALAATGRAPLASILAMATVTAYSLKGEATPPDSARRLGWDEMLVGIVSVVLIALGYRLGV